MITLESYIDNIDHLDILDGYSLENGSINMMMANEALGNISTINDTMYKKTQLIKHKLQNTNDPKEQLKIINELKGYLQKYKSDIQKVKPNFFDTKFAKRAASMVGIIGGILAIPCTFGISLMGIAGFAVKFMMDQSPEKYKKELIQNIDSQIQNCDKILKYLNSNDKIANEGMKDFISHRKHIYSIRKEHIDVNKEYIKLNKSTNFSERTSKFYDLSNNAETKHLLEKHKKSASILNRLGKELVSSFNKSISVISDGKYTVKFKTNIEYLNDDKICVHIYGDENDFQKIYEEDNNEKMYNEVIHKIDNIVNYAAKKYERYNSYVDSNPDNSCDIYFGINILD